MSNVIVDWVWFSDYQATSLKWITTGDYLVFGLKISLIYNIIQIWKMT
jgi:hypothetical protein